MAQFVAIAGGWLLTRSFRKIYMVVSDAGVTEPSPGLLSSWYANHGWLMLPVPLLVCAWMIWRIRKDSERHHSTAATGVFCIALTLAVFAACTWMTTRMMSAAVDPREVPLKLSVESR